MKDFLQDCGPGRVCPAYQAGKYPKLCCVLKRHRAERRLAVLVGIAIMLLTTAIVVSLSYMWH
jgi:hypothetical protein